jgi:hypothetical protein
MATVQFILQVGTGPTARILGVSGDWYAPDEFGPLGRKPKAWRTQAGAQVGAQALGRPEARVVPLVDGVPGKVLTCDGTCWGACSGPVTHIDEKGYAYCTTHGEHRRGSGIRCRRMLAWEVRRLVTGQTISYTLARNC